jgi:DUF4097 and DUF4098 domain-containing protein YvlB
MMRPPRLLTLALSAGFAWSSGVAGATHGNISTHSKSDEVRRCSDLDVEIDEEPAVTAEETLTAPGGSGNVLTVRPSQNGGVYVSGASRRDFAVTTCKAVARSGSSQAQLDAMRTTISGGTVSTTGTASDDTVVFYIVEAPSGAALDLAAHNGPISVREFTGRSTLRTQNGPVSLKNVGGTVKAFAQNGPIHFEGDSGTIDLETQNGPIGVRLSGTRWSDGSLTARAQNGPMQLKVPSGFTSGVRVESSNHSPWSCDGEGCGHAKKDWDTGSRSFALGEGPVLVRVSTVNGPVQVHAGN